MGWRVRKNGEPLACVIADRAQRVPALILEQYGRATIGGRFDVLGRGRYGFQVYADDGLFERVRRVSCVDDSHICRITLYRHACHGDDPVP